MQVVVYLGLDEITHKLVDARSGRLVFLRYGRPHVVRSEFGLGLAFEHRFFHIESNGRYNPVSDIGEFLILVVEFLDGTSDVFLQGTLMRTPLGGVLTVHKRIVLFAILVGMRESDFNILALQVYDFIKSFGGHVVLQQVLQAMTRENTLTIVNEGQARIQISIVSKQCFDELIQELIANEQGVVRFKEDEGTGFFGGIFGHIADELTFLESSPTYLSIPEAGYLETATERIHCLDTHPVQPDTFLECLGIVLTSRIQLTDCLNELALRNAATIVTDAHPKVVLDGHFDFLSGPHLELVDAVVHHFLQKDIDTVIALLSIAQTADVHTGADTDVLHVVQMSDILVGIFYGRFNQFFFHGILLQNQISFL